MTARTTERIRGEGDRRGESPTRGGTKKSVFGRVDSRNMASVLNSGRKSDRGIIDAIVANHFEMLARDMDNERLMNSMAGRGNDRKSKDPGRFLPSGARRSVRLSSQPVAVACFLTTPGRSLKRNPTGALPAIQRADAEALRIDALDALARQPLDSCRSPRRSAQLLPNFSKAFRDFEKLHLLRRIDRTCFLCSFVIPALVVHHFHGVL